MYLKYFFSVILLLVFILPISAQQNEFPIGVRLSGDTINRKENYWQVKDMGANMVIQDAVIGENLDSLKNFNSVIAWNGGYEDKVHHYSSGMYTNWEAEDDHIGYNTGIRTGCGVGDTYLLREGLKSRVVQYTDSLIYGPYYIQKHKYTMLYNMEPIQYTVRYNLALSRFQTQGNIPVCSLAVTYTYKTFGDTVKEVTLISRTLNAISDSLIGGNFKSFDLTYNYNSITDQKVEGFYLNENPSQEGGQLYGVQFKVIVFNTEDYELFVDNIEVFDNELWGYYVLNPTNIINQIINYDN